MRSEPPQEGSRSCLGRRRFRYPLNPLGPPFRRLEWLGVVAGLLPYLAVAELDDGHALDYCSAAVAAHGLGDPHVARTDQPAQANDWRSPPG